MKGDILITLQVPTRIDVLALGDSLNAELWSSATIVSAWLPDFRRLYVDRELRFVSIRSSRLRTSVIY